MLKYANNLTAKTLIKIPFLVRIAIIYICGIIIGIYLPIPSPALILLLFLFLSIFLLGIFSRKYPQVKALILYVSLMFVSAFYASSYPVMNIPDMEKFKDKFIRLTGTVVSDPDVRSWQTNLIVKADTIKFGGSDEVIPVNCRILVRVRFSKKDIFYGERYKFSGVLRIPQGSSFGNYFKTQKISALINVNNRKRVQYLGEERANPFIKQALKLKKVLANSLKIYVSPKYFPILGAMMFKTEMIPGRIKEMFAETGIIHILAISGLHVGILAGILILFLKLLNVPKRVSYAIVLILIIIYAFITGLRVPVVRASLMINLFLLGYIIRRRTDIFVTLAVACLLILLWNPYQILDVGFQLSFIAVLSIALITPRLEEIFRIKNLWDASSGRKLFVAGTLKFFLISVAAWLGTVPLAAYYFGYISWFGSFSNLFAIPLAALLLTCGFVLLLLIWVLPFLAVYLAVFVNFLLFLLLKFSEIVSSWPFVHTELPAFNVGIVFVCYFALVLFLFYPVFKKLIIEVKYAE